MLAFLGLNVNTSVDNESGHNYHHTVKNIMNQTCGGISNTNTASVHDITVSGRGKVDIDLSQESDQKMRCAFNNMFVANSNMLTEQKIGQTASAKPSFLSSSFNTNVINDSGHNQYNTEITKSALKCGGISSKNSMDVYNIKVTGDGQFDLKNHQQARSVYDCMMDNSVKSANTMVSKEEKKQEAVSGCPTPVLVLVVILAVILICCGGGYLVNGMLGDDGQQQQQQQQQGSGMGSVGSKHNRFGRKFGGGFRPPSFVSKLAMLNPETRAAAMAADASGVV